MELRKTIRENKGKRALDLSDVEDEDEVIVKKTKLTSKGKFLQSNLLTNGKYGFGRRVVKKNPTLDGYNCDSDSDFEAGPVDLKDPKPRKKRGTKPKEQNKIEYLLDWKREMIVSGLPTDEAASKVVTTDKIVEADLKKYGGDLQALFVNVNWCTERNPEGTKIEDFKKLDLNRHIMKNGIVFIWSEKETLGRMIKIMEDKGFFYIENYVIALLDASKAETICKPKKPEVKEIQTKIFSNKSSPANGVLAKTDCSESGSTTGSTKHAKVFHEDDNESEYFLQNMEKYTGLEAEQLLYEGSSEYLKISKRVLIMFRRTDPKVTLELRHQRTSDALFDLVDPTVPYGSTDLRTKEAVYKMIETLLPKALYNAEEPSLKMMELWADAERPREGWISVCEKLTV